MQCNEVRRGSTPISTASSPRRSGCRCASISQDCPDCGPEAAALERLRDDIRRAAPVYRAPEALRSRIRAAMRREAAAKPPSAGCMRRRWLAYAASILLAVAVGSGGTYVLVGERQTDRIAGEIVDGHVRSCSAAT